MKTILAAWLLLTAGELNAQSIRIDMQRDWYAIVPTLDMSVLDTLTLYPAGQGVPQGKDVFYWRYLGSKDYQLKMYNNAVQGLSGPYEYAPEHWKINETGENELYLQVRDRRDPRPFHKKVASYKLLPVRDNYNILYKVVMIKVYSNRYMEQLKKPEVMK